MLKRTKWYVVVNPGGLVGSGYDENQDPDDRKDALEMNGEVEVH